MDKTVMPSPEMLSKYADAMDKAVNLYLMAGDGCQAPGAIITRFEAGALHPWRVHFLNLQCGGYHAGGYHETESGAFEEFKERCLRYDKTGGLHHAIKASGNKELINLC